METIQTLVTFIKDNIESVLAVIGAVYTIALFIVKLTPTKKDDALLSKVYGFLHDLAGKLGIKK